MKRMPISVALVALVALTATACGGGGDAGPSNDAQPEGAGPVTLTMVDNAFSPTQLTVGPDASLRLVNDGEARHNLTIEDSTIDEDLDAGGSSTVDVVLGAGTYEMVCEYHRADGMVGTLTVKA